MDPNFVRHCQTCHELWSPYADHGICLPKGYEINTPSAILSKNLYEGKYNSKIVLDPIHKYSTLSQLNMTEYYNIFWTLHDVLAILFIKSLTKTNPSVNGISLDLFANILIRNVQELFNGNLDDVP